ncbi:UNVERIFIED_CONTAM: hypothetical protein PYX00_001195 [Menopon gallinae]|uniref:Uncharacterized protein n=1 Tax=Menopon gallinae TaxID=328185 RepID=A0AAW2IBM1_9NEOP
MDEGNAEKISEAIFNLIPEVTRLKELFQNWSLLDEDGKRFVDLQVGKWNSPGHIQLYETVKQALTKWGKVQDTEGAPGCDPGWFTFSCDIQLEEELINVLQTVENLLKRAEHASRCSEVDSKTAAEDLTDLTDAPPSSPDSDDAMPLLSPEKRRSEPFRMNGRSRSLGSGRRFCYYRCHAVRSAPIFKDGYNTD